MASAWTTSSASRAAPPPPRPAPRPRPHAACAPAARRKKEARVVHRRSQYAQKVKGLRAKLFNKKRFQEKAEMKKTSVPARLAGPPCPPSRMLPLTLWLAQLEGAPREERRGA